jgi:similar to spore coat protein
MDNVRLSPHETVEIREFIGQEMLGIKKINASINMVNDIELKNYMNDSLASKKTALQNIKSTLGSQPKTV